MGNFDICLHATAGTHWEQQWSYLLSNFAPRNLYVIGEVDPRVRPFVGLTSIESADEIPSELVVMSPQNGYEFQGVTSLIDFVHPDDCCYLFGSDSVHLTADQMGVAVPAHIVYIPTSTKDNMYSFVAGAVTLYDRMVKGG